MVRKSKASRRFMKKRELIPLSTLPLQELSSVVKMIPPFIKSICNSFTIVGWMVGGAMVLGKLPVPRRPTIWMKVGQGPIALVVGAGGVCSDIFTLFYIHSFFSLSLGGCPI